MKDTAPKSLGIIAVSALFGIIAAGVAYVLYEFGFSAGLGIGLLVALITAVVLMLGWREPAPREVAPTGTPRSASAAPAATPAPAAAPAAAAAPELAKVAEPEEPAAPTPVSEPEPTGAPAPAPMEAEAPVVQSSKPLPGEAELDAKKGEWKYDGPGSEQDAAPAAAGEAEKPQFLSEAREGGPDDLKQIRGVGKKLEETLHGMGIFHFDQIAAWGPNEQAWMDDNLKGFKGRASRDKWVEQAKILAAGGATEFSDKVKDGDVY
ncbi:NADH:ubiquinone oxidoreductase [Yoonia sp. 2307UL14-13]|uniref:NADH:ubiquinone oxidoreductase n=1 Tax=Yoonia sp. 2307UL14-13 TaxID=3126506 RepID=UPI0030A4089A